MRFTALLLVQQLLGGAEHAELGHGIDEVIRGAHRGQRRAVLGKLLGSTEALPQPSIVFRLQGHRRIPSAGAEARKLELVRTHLGDELVPVVGDPATEPFLDLGHGLQLLHTDVARRNPLLLVEPDAQIRDGLTVDEVLLEKGHVVVPVLGDETELLVVRLARGGGRDHERKGVDHGERADRQEQVHAAQQYPHGERASSHHTD